MKKQMVDLALEALSDAMPVFPLTSDENFPQESCSLDFMVPTGKALLACRLVAEAALDSGWLLVLFRDVRYLAQIVLMRPENGGRDEVIRLDFFDGMRWYGVGEDVLGQLLFESILPQSPSDEKLCSAVSFFHRILTAGCVTERDWERVAATGADIAYLTDIARVLNLPLAATDIKCPGLVGFSKWRLRSAVGGARPSSMIKWMSHTMVAHIRYCIGAGTKVDMVVGISGLDGSGKSTLVDRLLAGYRKAGCCQPSLIHLLPSWIPMPHQLALRRKTVNNYTKPYCEPPVKSRLNGGLRLLYYMLAFGIAKSAIYYKSKRGHLLFLDRSFLDFASDPTRSRIPFSSLPHWLIRLLIPEGLLFYLDASPEVVVRRKGELSLEKARSLRCAYLETSSVVGATLLKADRPSDAVFSELLEHVSREYLRRIKAAEAKVVRKHRF